MFRRHWGAVTPALILTVAGRALAQQPPAPPDATVTPAKEEASKKEDDATDLAKKTQNPIANLVSFPFQFNFNGDIGPDERTQLVLNIQPVLPTRLSKQWSLITRWVLPVMDQPDRRNVGAEWGIGDFNPQLFLALEAGDFTFGAGPALLIPTATSGALGTGKFSLGPALVGVFSGGGFVAGVLGTYVASIAGDDQRSGVSLMTVQPFVNYNLPGGAYLTTSPLMTFDLEAGQTTLPLGGGFGKVFHFGDTPVNFSVQGFGNAIHPDGGPTWQLRFVMQLLYPQHEPKKSAEHR